VQDIDRPDGPTAKLEERMRTLHVGSVLMLFTLAVQFILGMANNLFGTFPATSDVLQALSSGDAMLVAHMSVAFVLLALGILVAVLAFRRPIPRRVAALGVAGVLGIFWAFESGIEFVLSGFSNNLWSFSMSLGFLVVLVIYGALTLTSAVNGGRLFVSRFVVDVGPNAGESKSG
jgi:hypothetical protein